MVWQRAGTVAVQTGSTTVVGTNLDFAASSRNGDSFVGPDGATYEVANVASSTVISILPPYKGPTVSGAAYAIMPVQGYDKKLSDAFNALNNQFGPKLAALGTTGNYEILPVIKGGTGAENVAGAQFALGIPTADAPLPLGKGGTGAKTKEDARTSLGLGRAATADILGLVSQAAGVPTGAVIESGSNANGTFMKLADGTMICTATTASITWPAGSSGGWTWTFPAAFAGVPPKMLAMNYTNSPHAFNQSTLPTSTSSGNVYIGGAANGASGSGCVLAIGRWF